MVITDVPPWFLSIANPLGLVGLFSGWLLGRTRLKLHARTRCQQLDESKQKVEIYNKIKTHTHVKKKRERNRKKKGKSEESHWLVKQPSSFLFLPFSFLALCAVQHFNARRSSKKIGQDRTESTLLSRRLLASWLVGDVILNRRDAPSSTLHTHKKKGTKRRIFIEFLFLSFFFSCVLCVVLLFPPAGLIPFFGLNLLFCFPLSFIWNGEESIPSVAVVDVVAVTATVSAVHNTLIKPIKALAGRWGPLAVWRLLNFLSQTDANQVDPSPIS